MGRTPRGRPAGRGRPSERVSQGETIRRVATPDSSRRPEASVGSLGPLEQRNSEIDALRRRLDELEQSQAGQRDRLTVLSTQLPRSEGVEGVQRAPRTDRERSPSRVREPQRRPRSRDRHWTPASERRRRRVDSSSESPSSRCTTPPYISSEPTTASVMAPPGNWMTEAMIGAPRNANIVPNFSGTDKEDWAVWLDRLEYMADENRWTDNQKRHIIMSTVRDKAARFVFRTLNIRERDNYRILVRKMNQRFIKIEIPQAFKSRWNAIRQRPGEDEQDLAAYVRTVYEKAFRNRDPETAREDLLSKFLDALADPEQRLAVEFGKEPRTIDEAVAYAIHYREAKRSQKVAGRHHQESIRAIKEVSTSRRVDGTTQVEPPSKRRRAGPNKQDNTGARDVRMTGVENQRPGPHDLAAADLYRFTDFIKMLKEDSLKGSEGPRAPREGGQGRRPKGPCFSCRQMGHFAYECPQDPAAQTRRRPRVQGPCYICNQMGHLARNCPHRSQLNINYQRGIPGNPAVATSLNLGGVNLAAPGNGTSPNPGSMNPVVPNQTVNNGSGVGTTVPTTA